MASPALKPVLKINMTLSLHVSVPVALWFPSVFTEVCRADTCIPQNTVLSVCFLIFWLHSQFLAVVWIGDSFLSSVHFSRIWLFATHELQHARPPCPSPTPGVHPDSCPLSRWCHPAISSSVVPFSSCPQSLPASKSFPMSHLFTWGGQSIGVSALASVLPKNTQDWSPLEWTGWISLQSKGLSRIFFNTTVQKHQFFGAQPSSQSNSRSLQEN